MRRTILIPAVLVALASCDEGNARITGPSEQSFVSNGLEQQLRVETNLPWDNTGEWFQLTSRLINRGDAPMQVRVATCVLELGEDIRTRAELIGRAQPSCIAAPNLITLAPGEASRSISFTGLIQDPGRWTFRVRHAQDPEIWGEIEVEAK